MKLEQFQELAPKTVNLFEDNRLNLLHMATGMSGEMLSELMIAGLREDMPNILEESTDAKWYIVVLAGWKGFKLDSTKLSNWTIKNPDINITSAPGLRANLVVGTLVDVIKREAVYGMAKYQKVEVTPEKYQELIYDALKAIDEHLSVHGLDPEKGYDVVIQKLHGVRYANSDGSVGFTEEAALNRNLEEEKKAIDR